MKINELDAIVAGFNVGIQEEAKELIGNIKVMTEEVVYKLIDNLSLFRNEKRMKIEKERLMGIWWQRW